MAESFFIKFKFVVAIFTSLIRKPLQAMPVDTPNSFENLKSDLWYNSVAVCFYAFCSPL